MIWRLPGAFLDTGAHPILYSECEMDVHEGRGVKEQLSSLRSCDTLILDQFFNKVEVVACRMECRALMYKWHQVFS